MGEKLVIGPINQGIRTDRTQFVIDNDSFPILQNAYQWRGRIKRKRGTSLLNRLQRSVSVNGISLTGETVNLISALSLQSNSAIVPGTINIVGGTDGTTYTDPSSNGVLLATGGTGSGGSINYASGLLTITAGGSQSLTGTISYYPVLPVMGLEDLYTGDADFLKNISFDTTYAYTIPNTSPYTPYSVSFYKNPTGGTINGIAYNAKTTWTPVTWNGQTYQQFWSVNYNSGFWETNGVTVPYSSTNIGMQFKPIATVTYVSATELTITITEASQTLVIGDWVFINEVTGTGNDTVNFQTGFVTASANAAGTTTLTVRFPYATIGNNVYAGGILQYLTNRSDTTKDCIRWYDGDPTAGTPPDPSSTFGWVNFCPPISQASFSIGDLPQRQYYLVGAKLIFPFKDRIIFFGAVVQSSQGSPIYLQDTIVYSQNGTPYYTASFPATAGAGSITSASTEFTPMLTPGFNPASASSVPQIATPNAYFADVTGFGGFQTVGVDQPITTVSSNEDVLIVGFSFMQTRMTYTGNDIIPFNFYVINSELGSGSTFSAINMDRGVMTRGKRGYIITSQTGTQRVDLQIPDEVFEMPLNNNNSERVSSQRDFINEWVYFTTSNNQNDYDFPNQTLQYNYRDDSWGIFYESYTTYGTFRKSTGYTWATIGSIFPTWASWNTPWNAGDSTILQPIVIGGNAQGFVMCRDEGTSEGTSVYIKSISGSVITSPNHMLNEGDYIIISGALGTVGNEINNKVFSIQSPDDNSFTLNPNISGGLTYLGSGLITRCYVPFIQTKQFPLAWADARKTRLGPQQYLLSRTASGEITLLIFLSQDENTAYNTFTGQNPQLPYLKYNNVEGVVNSGSIYSTVLYTCPESTNLGLTPANVNLNTPTASSQQRIWHRINTSLIGDTVQVGFMLSDTQMRDEDRILQFAEIELHGIILDVQPSQLLC